MSDTNLAQHPGLETALTTLGEAATDFAAALTSTTTDTAAEQIPEALYAAFELTVALQLLATQIAPGPYPAIPFGIVGAWDAADYLSRRFGELEARLRDGATVDQITADEIEAARKEGAMLREADVRDVLTGLAEGLEQT